MKKEKTPLPTTGEKKSGIASNPENKFKKGKPDPSLDKIITSAVGKVKAVSGDGLADEGTTVSYHEER